MASQMMLLDECLPMDALGLGTLVESIHNPVMDAYVPKETLPADAILKIPAKSFQGLASSSSESSFRLALTRLFGISHSSEDGTEASLRSIKVIRYVLKQPREIFKSLCYEDEKARQWLNDGIQAGSKSYLVVELQTAMDPKITRSDTRKRSTDANASIPVDAIAPGVGIALDTSVNVGRVLSNESIKAFEMEGETIFAVGYKKVTWKSWGFRRKDIDKAMLDTDISWSLLGQKRSRDDEDEMISVDLADSLDARANNQETDTEDEEEESDDQIANLLRKGVEIDGQTYLVQHADLKNE
ncbi:hypothetical protein CC78DRAFT_572475 [Lojkania enalia]|uniref:Uncharacterized protein n=1 Tax=Lojkania enalia TaxID=147567 RepID=A0A9P4JWL1_9PLEO|nr:hypothetical protein CC78DRAFT_572475 [Didymosphaeria enalia]